MVTESQLDPKSLVARIIAELEANPEAQRMLLRALLTNEFLGIPARLDAIEKDIAELKVDVNQLKVDVNQLKTDVNQLKVDVNQLKTDVRHLKGSALENRLHRRIRSRVAESLRLRRPRIMQSPLLEPLSESADMVDNAFYEGRITEDQDERIQFTDFILRAQRRGDRSQVWVVVEVSNRVGERDIRRAKMSAAFLALVFPEDIIPVAAGYSIDLRDLARAEAEGVRYLEVQEEE
jgi:outer membrane murein-binding lipoprotein Lpp